MPNKVPISANRPLRGHLDRVRTIMSKHADSVLAAAGYNDNVAAHQLIDSLAADTEFAREVDAMDRINRKLTRPSPSKRRRRP